MSFLRAQGNRLGDRELTRLQEDGWVIIYLPIYLPYLVADLDKVGLSIHDVELEMVGGLVRVTVVDWKEYI